MTQPILLDQVASFSESHFVRRRLVETAHMHVNMYCIRPGQHNPLHRHPISDEVLYFVQGEGEVRVGDEVVPVRARSIVHVPVNAPHEIRNTGTTDMIAVLAQAPLPCEHVPVRADRTPGSGAR